MCYLQINLGHAIRNFFVFPLLKKQGNSFLFSIESLHLSRLPFSSIGNCRLVNESTCHSLAMDDFPVIYLPLYLDLPIVLCSIDLYVLARSITLIRNPCDICRKLCTSVIYIAVVVDLSLFVYERNAQEA